MKIRITPKPKDSFLSGYEKSREILQTVETCACMYGDKLRAFWLVINSNSFSFKDTEKKRRCFEFDKEKGAETANEGLCGGSRLGVWAVSLSLCLCPLP